jgi:signal transduction histidine kinase
VIEQVANDGTRIIRRLQDFSRTGGEQTCMKVDVNRIIQQVVDITQYRWKNEAEAKGIKIEVLTQLGKLSLFKADPSELSEVLINIIINAMDAMPQGGKMILKSWEADASIYVSVEDTGMGIREEDKRRIFDPFFTTKGAKGVGLGLSVAYGIVTRYGGKISVESEPNLGSTFVVELPIRESLEQELPEKIQHPHLQQEKVWIKDKKEELKDPFYGTGSEEKQNTKVR